MSNPPPLAAISLVFPPRQEGGWGTERLVEAIANHDRPGGAGRDKDRSALCGVARAHTQKLIRLMGTDLAEMSRAGNSPFGFAAQGERSNVLADLLARRWGRDFEDPHTVLRRLRNLTPVCLIEPALAEWVAGHCTVPGMTADSWQQAQTSAILSETYLKDLIYYSGKLSLFDEMASGRIEKKLEPAPCAQARDRDCRTVRARHV